MARFSGGFDLTGFSFANQSLSHWLFFILAVLLQAFSLATCLSALRDRRWVWAIASLFGVFQIAIGWDMDGWAAYPISIGIPIMGAFRLGAEGRAVGFYIPVFALAYWFSDYGWKAGVETG